MTKAAICVACSDIISPRRAWKTDRSWRWCECDHTGVRWRDGDRGLLEVTSFHGPAGVRVLGISNLFLHRAVADPEARGGLTDEEWRELHHACAEHVEPHYLFHEDRRACWALIVRVGESGDVTFVDHGDVSPPTHPTDAPTNHTRLRQAAGPAKHHRAYPEGEGVL
jgi:hypothetical protein